MITTELDELTLAPNLVIDTEDHRSLTRLAHAGISEASTVADDLLYELGRASVVPPEQLPLDAVRMGSAVRYRTADDEEREVSLVYPEEAGFSHNSVSVMTPIGAALIGLRKGQSITWLSRGGRRQMLTVLSVTQRAV